MPRSESTPSKEPRRLAAEPAHVIRLAGHKGGTALVIGPSGDDGVHFSSDAPIYATVLRSSGSSGGGIQILEANGRPGTSVSVDVPPGSHVHVTGWSQMTVEPDLAAEIIAEVGTGQVATFEGDFAAGGRGRVALRPGGVLAGEGGAVRGAERTTQVVFRTQADLTAAIGNLSQGRGL